MFELRLGDVDLFALCIRLWAAGRLGLFESEAGRFQSLARERDFRLLPLLRLQALRLSDSQFFFGHGRIEQNESFAGLYYLPFADRRAHERTGDEHRTASRLQRAERMHGTLGCWLTKRLTAIARRSLVGAGWRRAAIADLKGQGGQSTEGHSQEQ